MISMRQATIAGLRCLAMMEERTEQLRRKDGSIEDVTVWAGECRVPGPYSDQMLKAALLARPVSYSGPLKRKGGRVEIVEGEVVIEPHNPAGMAELGGLTGILGEGGPDPGRFKLTGSGSPTVVEDE